MTHNKTFSISPNDNVSEWFYTPHSGNLKVEGYMKPTNPNIWVNLSWSVYYGDPPRLYQVYPAPFIDNGMLGNYYHVSEEFPVVSFGQGTSTPQTWESQSETPQPIL